MSDDRLAFLVGVVVGAGTSAPLYVLGVPVVVCWIISGVLGYAAGLALAAAQERSS